MRASGLVPLGFLAFSLAVLGCGAAEADPGAGGGPAACGPSDCLIEHPECRGYAGCSDGVCSFVDLADGVPLLDQTPGDCVEIVCDGAGGIRVDPRADDVEDDGNSCTLDACDGATPTHTFISHYACYTGPAGTLGVGVCAAGIQQCDAQGHEVGVCEGDVTPVPEACDAIGHDEDCDGVINEQDAHCCGDGALAFGELCDDGNDDPHDGCTPLCQPPKCGDGFVHPELGEECDGEPHCSAACVLQEVTAVDAGDRHTCALLRGGALKCWGSNDDGQLGLGDIEARGDAPGEMGDKLPAIDLGAGAAVKALAVGAQHTCALLADGRVKCWGFGTYGQLGIGEIASRGDEPGEMGDQLPAVNLGAGRTATALASGAHHVCALLDDGSLKCWGYNHVGQLGLGDTEVRGDELTDMGDKLPAVKLGTGRKAVALALGDAHTCALLDDASVKCWGGGGGGQLGQGTPWSIGDHGGTMGDALPAVDLGAGVKAVAITAGRQHNCALLDDGSVKCWGINNVGQLGLGDTEWRGEEPGEMGDALPAVDLGAGVKAVAIAAGDDHTCARLAGGGLKCWGAGYSGELGLGDGASRGDAPGEMGDALPIVGLGVGRSAAQLAGGEQHTCALLDDGTVKCWGDADYGQLGSGAVDALGNDPGEMGDALPRVKLFSDSW